MPLNVCYIFQNMLQDRYDELVYILRYLYFPVDLKDSPWNEYVKLDV